MIESHRITIIRTNPDASDFDMNKLINQIYKHISQSNKEKLEKEKEVETCKVKKCKPLNIHYKNIKIKQYSKVTYLSCILDETLSGESMAIHVINKINSRLRFLYRQNRYLSFPLRRLLCNAMIQPFFDYACNAWYPNINKKLKTRLQAAQNKCIRFCLKLDDRFRLKSKEFERIN